MGEKFSASGFRPAENFRKVSSGRGPGSFRRESHHDSTPLPHISQRSPKKKMKELIVPWGVYNRGNSRKAWQRLAAKVDIGQCVRL
jgi:hypothetical protein